MIKINLISPIDKENLKWEKISLIVFSFGIKVVIIQFFFVVLLASSIFYLKTESDKASGELTYAESLKETVEIRQMENGLKGYEKYLANISGIHQNHIQWADVIDIFSKLVPEGVKINTISFKPLEVEVRSEIREKGSTIRTDYSKITLDISGDALKRENLMEFEKKISDSEVFVLNESKDPSYNKYVNSENINFRFSFLIDRAKLISSINNNYLAQ